ncbi:MAG: TraR/DksA family transcriptional regulator [Acidimicrobiales bacterium]
MALADDRHDEPAAGRADRDAAPGTVGDYAALLSRAEAMLDDVDRALSRLDQGTYGRCEVCGGAVDDDRLSSDPTATTCGDHADAGASPGMSGTPGVPDAG